MTLIENRVRRGVALAAGGVLLISLDSLGFRLTEASNWNIAFWYGLFTSIAMGLVVRLRSGRSLFRVIRQQRWPLIASGLLQATSTAFFILALSVTTVSNTVVILAAAPIAAAVIARWTIGERTSPRVWIGIVVAFFGIVVVVFGSLGAGRLGGDLYAVVAIVAFGANLTIWRRMPELNRAAAIGIAGMVMAIVSIVPSDPAAVSRKALLILALLGGVVGAGGRTAIATSTRYLPTAQVGLFAPIETIAATAWAWLFLNEAPPPATLVGGLIVLSAVVYGATAPVRDQRTTGAGP